MRINTTSCVRPSPHIRMNCVWVFRSHCIIQSIYYSPKQEDILTVWNHNFIFKYEVIITPLNYYYLRPWTREPSIYRSHSDHHSVDPTNNGICLHTDTTNCIVRNVKKVRPHLKQLLRCETSRVCTATGTSSDVRKARGLHVVHIDFHSTRVDEADSYERVAGKTRREMLWWKLYGNANVWWYW